MRTYLRKIDPTENQRRFYTMTAAPTLFGEWVVIREYGRLDNQGSRVVVTYHESEAAARDVFQKLKRSKERRGYNAAPEQLLLPF